MAATEAEKAAEASRRDAVVCTTPCPYCDALPGQRCIDVETFQRSNRVHRSRVTAWYMRGKPS